MKKVILIAGTVVVAFFSCKKEGNEKDKSPENLCPVVAAADVPKVVKSAFIARYPTDSVQTWFNKDSVAYCAVFTSAGVEKLAQFANNGTFVKEGVEMNKNENYQDSTTSYSKSAGCECDFHDGKD